MFKLINFIEHYYLLLRGMIGIIFGLMITITIMEPTSFVECIGGEGNAGGVKTNITIPPDAFGRTSALTHMRVSVNVIATNVAELSEQIILTNRLLQPGYSPHKSDQTDVTMLLSQISYVLQKKHHFQLDDASYSSLTRWHRIASTLYDQRFFHAKVLKTDFLRLADPHFTVPSYLSKYKSETSSVLLAPLERADVKTLDDIYKVIGYYIQLKDRVETDGLNAQRYLHQQANILNILRSTANDADPYGQSGSADLKLVKSNVIALSDWIDIEEQILVAKKNLVYKPIHVEASAPPGPSAMSSDDFAYRVAAEKLINLGAWQSTHIDGKEMNNLCHLANNIGELETQMRFLNGIVANPTGITEKTLTISTEVLGYIQKHSDNPALLHFSDYEAQTLSVWWGVKYQLFKTQASQLGITLRIPKYDSSTSSYGTPFTITDEDESHSQYYPQIDTTKGKSRESYDDNNNNSSKRVAQKTLVITDQEKTATEKLTRALNHASDIEENDSDNDIEQNDNKEQNNNKEQNDREASALPTTAQTIDPNTIQALTKIVRDNNEAAELIAVADENNQRLLTQGIHPIDIAANRLKPVSISTPDPIRTPHRNLFQAFRARWNSNNGHVRNYDDSRNLTPAEITHRQNLKKHVSEIASRQNYKFTDNVTRGRLRTSNYYFHPEMNGTYRKGDLEYVPRTAVDSETSDDTNHPYNVRQRQLLALQKEIRTNNEDIDKDLNSLQGHKAVIEAAAEKQNILMQMQDQVLNEYNIAAQNVNLEWNKFINGLNAKRAVMLSMLLGSTVLGGYFMLKTWQINPITIVKIAFNYLTKHVAPAVVEKSISTLKSEKSSVLNPYVTGVLGGAAVAAGGLARKVILTAIRLKK